MTEKKYIVAPADCMGCALCANLCPRDAITMEWSENGFLVPRVREELCVNCGKCAKECPAGETPLERHDDMAKVRAYGAWNKDASIHRSSSSGGVFTALAMQTLSQGGCVFGVVWKDKSTAGFSKAERPEELAAMRGSKYTQAVPSYVYREVRAELRKGRSVLFSGTPCQVRALKKFLGKDDANLMTVDVVCHGVPSHLLLEAYVRETEEASGKELSRIDFRDKTAGWQTSSTRRHYTDGSTDSRTFHVDEYHQLFLCDAILNVPCDNCPYAHLPRQGDVSLADYWGVQNHHPDWPLRDGVSVILVNTERGHQAIEETKALTLMETSFLSVYNAQRRSLIRAAAKPHRHRARTLQALKEGREKLSTLVSYIRDYKDIGPLRINRTTLPYRTLLRIRSFLRTILKRY